MFDLGTLGTVLAVLAGLFVAYWLVMFFLVGFAQRDLERRGIASAFSYVFLLSTPLGLILWLVARKFFPVRPDKALPARVTTAREIRAAER